MTGVEPIAICLVVLAAACLLTWVLSLITGEHSWVDRIWSIVPVGYVWVFAVAAGLEDARLDLLAALVTLWGVRLTFNFARKGGYRPGGEDYRWEVLRGRMRPAAFQVFNLLFIVIYQNVLLLLIALPAWTAYLHPSPLDPLDVVLAALFLAFLLGETVADQQQWRFQQWKKREAAAGRVSSPRFLQTGLFRYSRHPNFFFEQAQWWVVFLFGCVAAGSLLQWTVIGPLLLTGLFVGSTVFTERISRSRYPEYAEYQARTSPVVPWFPGRGKDARMWSESR
jgi:steroid 5-alpha reductase family enzyme